ncbi:synaptojanin-2-binding protein [Antrostomus carolinensis]|uniref:synaptojanin-2-binding protein n=1 Tax=Antrostomus carolinensis TaxID=279965 RepID=UPI0010A9896B|nr:synaptojanin-2-binding protein [Antrostomus carolinensis]
MHDLSPLRIKIRSPPLRICAELCGGGRRGSQRGIFTISCSNPTVFIVTWLGFNIVGGTDQQYISNDSSIYVSRIKKDGAAYLDGRLQEGDKILAVNGRDLKDLRHKDAVELFRSAGYDVSLKIQRRLQPQNGPVGHRGDGESGGLPLAAILVPGLALAAAAVWILLRYRQRM